MCIAVQFRNEAIGACTLATRTCGAEMPAHARAFKGDRPTRRVASTRSDGFLGRRTRGWMGADPPGLINVDHHALAAAAENGRVPRLTLDCPALSGPGSDGSPQPPAALIPRDRAAPPHQQRNGSRPPEAALRVRANVSTESASSRGTARLLRDGRSLQAGMTHAGQLLAVCHSCAVTKVASIPTCEECRKVWLPGDDERWKAYWIDDGDEDVLVFYCVDCGDREFGQFCRAAHERTRPGLDDIDLPYPSPCNASISGHGEKHGQAALATLPIPSARLSRIAHSRRPPARTFRRGAPRRTRGRAGRRR